MDRRTKFYFSVFVGRWFFSLQDPIFSGIFRIFRGLFELDLPL